MNISFLELANDCSTFNLLQLLFFLFFLSIYVYDKRWIRKKGGVIIEVKRGDTSWGYFASAYGFLSLILLQIINTTEAWKGYKTITTIIDLWLLMYLCFYSSWFRNKIVGMFEKSKNMTEN